ncbi:DNA-binding response OmpR family regulator [Actinoallomurus bryophytorum]|uniref:DNA-binding response OmpR family regulator n=1 Tax=Actinoallomurus bryophytorum TaxID=1490222 RepID=A0A543CWG2_9ACTN|nr:response regulator transcription factor [Actinoallomurus bryophytorum]TQM01445.1 DNA-binding response OmpR family regulator [Actinoallomurus bryophytorum]
MQRILVVEDEPTIAQAVAARLGAEGFEVRVVGDGPTAVEGFRAYVPDLVVLDLMLPGMDGLEVCRRIQAERPAPVLMLTARDDETDLLVGLAVGADDYLTKPFSMRELTARVRTLLRRVEHAAALAAAAPVRDVVRLGPLEIDRAARKVSVDGAPVHLTPIEYELLNSLARTPGTVLTRAVLLEQVWDWSDGAGTRVVDSHVKALRRKLGADLIRTVHSVGYALEITP